MDKFLRGSTSSSSTAPGFSSSSSTLKLLTWNIDSITPASGVYKGRNKLVELLAHMSSKGGGAPDVISLQEVKLKSTESSKSDPAAR